MDGKTLEDIQQFEIDSRGELQKRIEVFNERLEEEREAILDVVLGPEEEE